MGEKLSYSAALTKASGPPHPGPLGHKEAAMALPSWPALQQGRLAFYSSRNWSIDQAVPQQQLWAISRGSRRLQAFLAALPEAGRI